VKLIDVLRNSIINATKNIFYPFQGVCRNQAKIRLLNVLSEVGLDPAILQYKAEVPKQWDATPGALLVFCGAAKCLYKRYIYF
jgi:hypothetical protein